MIIDVFLLLSKRIIGLGTSDRGVRIEEIWFIIEKDAEKVRLVFVGILKIEQGHICRLNYCLILTNTLSVSTSLLFRTISFIMPI